MTPDDNAGQPPPLKNGGTKHPKTPPTGNGRPVEEVKQPVEKGGLRGRFASLLMFLLLASGIVVAVVSLLALLGWFLGLPLLASFKADYIPMAPSTAALFLLYGTAVCLRAREPLSRRAFVVSVTMAGLGMVVALLLFALGSLNIHPAMEHFGMDASATVHGMVIGQMSPVSALCFVVAGLSFLASLPPSGTRLWRNTVALGAAGLLLAACFVFLQAYLFGAPLLYGGTFIPPALNTILAFTVLGLALLALASRSAGLLNGSPASDPGVAFIFVLILALVTAGIATVGYRSYRNLERNAYSTAERQLAAIADLKVEELVQYRKERLGDANTFYNNPAFSDRVRRFLDQPADADARGQLLAWLGRFQSYFEYSRIYLLDVQGVARLAVPDQPEPLPGRLAKDIALCLQSGQIQFVDFNRDAPRGPIQLEILVPIFDGSDTNRPLGVLGLRIDPKTYLYPLISRWPVPSETAETLLVRREGNEAVLLTDLRFQTNTALIRHFPLTSTNILPVQAALGQTGIVEGKDYRGARVIGDLRPIPNSPWFMVSRENVAEEFEPLRRQLSQLIFTLGVLLFGAVAGVGLIWRNQRARFYRRQMEAETGLAQMSRLYAALSQINQAIVWTPERDAMLEKICRALVENGGFRMAWIGQPDAKTQRVKPVAKWGDSTDYLSQAVIYADDRPEGRGPTGTAIREGKNYICNDFARDPNTLPWHGLADRAGFRSSAAFPIRQGGAICGALTIYSDEIGFFQDKEIALLEEACNDISFALDNLAREELRRQAETALRASEAEFRTLAEAMPQIVWMTRPDGWNIYFNQQWVDYTGLTFEESHGHGWNKPFHPDDQQRAWDAWQAATTKLAEYSIECRLRRADGEYRWWLIRGVPLRDAAGNVIKWFGTCTDIHNSKLAKEALRRSREEFKDLFENAPVGFHEIDTEGRIVRINNTGLKMLGYTAEELLGQFVWKISADEELSRRTALLKLGGGLLPPPEGFEREFRRKDGSTFPALIIDRLLEKEDGSITGIRAAIQDITERKRAKEKAAENQERFKLIFESIPVGIALARQHPDGRFERVINDAHLRICGLTREQDQIPGIYLKITHPEDAARQAELGRPFSDGRDGQLAMEKRYLRPDGAVVWVAFTFQRRHCADGGIEELTTVVDISERKQAEEALRQSEAQLQEAQRIASMGSYSHDIASGHWSSSPALDDLFGIDASYDRSVAGWAAMVHPDDRAMMVDHFENEVLARHCPFNKEYRIVRHNDQTERWVHGMGKLEFDATGRPVKMVGTIQDITERRKLEAQFRQSQKMEAIGQLAGGVAHDFNNILAVIQMQADLLKTDAGITPAQLELAEGIANAAQRAASLTRQLLMFSRKQMLQLRDLDLNESINDMTKMLRRTLGEHIQLQFKFAMQPLFIHADAGMMDQVLMNLAVNARDAMPKGGQLVIETSAVEFDESVRAQSPQARPGSFVCLSVSDTGCGIPPEILPQIFEPFFTTKEVGKGTGLGLATVFGIVQQHQGWINVYSEAGRGTTFRIYLPRLAGMSGQKPEPSELAAVRGGNETILLVEDEPFLRESAGKVLSQLGYRVLEAANGNEALEIWKQQRDEIQLLLTDLVMPGGMTGMDLGERLLKEKPELKVIYASGYSAEIAGKDFPLEEGVNFLTKPFSSRQLAQTVRNSLDNI